MRSKKIMLNLLHNYHGEDKEFVKNSLFLEVLIDIRNEIKEMKEVLNTRLK